MRTLFAILAVAVSVTYRLDAQAQLLNGGFESPDVTANSVAITTPTSWTGSGASIIDGNISPGYPLPHGGSQYLALGNAGNGGTSLSQTFGVGSPGVYPLTWFDSSEFNGLGASSPYTVSVRDGLSNIVASANFDANALVLRAWTQRSMTLSLASGTTYTLRFQSNQSPGGEATLIDDASIVIVPEPTAFLLACIVMGSAVPARIGRGKHRRA